MQRQVTVFIGRFSPFHLGHEEVLLRALKSSEVVLLLIGSAYQSRNIKNPFTAEERAKVIREWYDAHLRLGTTKDFGTLYIDFVEDHPYNDQLWMRSVQGKVEELRKKLSTPSDWPNVLTGADRDESTWYLKVFGSFFKLDLLKNTMDLSGTQIRENYFSGGLLYEYKTPFHTMTFLDTFKKGPHFQRLVDEYNFIKKYKESWKAAPYSPTFVTVDSVVVQSGHVLVITRGAQPGNGLWALPGGFVEQHERLKDAAVRELIEETSIGLSKAQLYGSITDKEIFDNPNRSLRGRTITTCFLFQLKDSADLPKIKGQPGEVGKIMWVPIAKALWNSDMWYEDHHAILETMIGRIKN